MNPPTHTFRVVWVGGFAIKPRGLRGLMGGTLPGRRLVGPDSGGGWGGGGPGVAPKGLAKRARQKGPAKRAKDSSPAPQARGAGLARQAGTDSGRRSSGEYGSSAPPGFKARC